MTKKYFILYIALAILSVFSGSANATKPAGTYSIPSIYWPTQTGGVNQSLVKRIPSYVNSNASGWWFCGQAALASTINYMRQGFISDNTKISQLQWIHEKLLELQGGYSSDANKQATIDGLVSVMKTYKSQEFSVRKISGYGEGDLGRGKVRDEILDTLKVHGAYPLALTQITVGGQNYGHFVVIFKVVYNPMSSTGGTVHYWDPYFGTTKSNEFSKFMDGMRDAGTSGRYSFIRVFKN